MTNLTQNKFLRACQTIACVSLLTGTLHAKQCIGNRGSYVIEVSWYTPDSIVLDSTGVDAGVLKVLHERKPVKTEVIPATQVRCLHAEDELTAVIVIRGLLGQGHMWRQSQVQLYNAKVWIDRAVSRHVNAVVRRGVTLSAQTFLVATPPKTEHLDFWGTVSDPQFGPGRPTN